MEVVASLPQGRTAAAQCSLFTHKSVPVIFEPPCIYVKTFGEITSFIMRLCGSMSWNGTCVCVLYVVHNAQHTTHTLYLLTKLVTRKRMNKH